MSLHASHSTTERDSATRLINHETTQCRPKVRAPRHHNSPKNESPSSEVRVSDSDMARLPWTSLEMLPRDRRLIQPLLRKFCALPPLGIHTGARTKANTRNLGMLAKPWFQTNYRQRTKHTVAWSLLSVAKGVYHIPRMSSPIRTSHELSNQSRPTVGHVILAALWVRSYGQRFGVGSSKSTAFFGLGNRVFWNPHRDHGSWRIAYDVNVEDRERTIRGA